MSDSSISAASAPKLVAPSPAAPLAVPPPQAGQLEVWLRCYAPFKTFGGGYRGDARSESTDVKKTARVVFVLTIDYVKMVVSKAPSARCDESHGHGLFPVLMSLPVFSARTNWSKLTVSGTATPRFSLVVEPVGRPGQGMAAAISVSGGNPLVLLAPDIDVQLNLKMKKEFDTALVVSGNVTGDAFPNCEIFLRDAKGRTALIHAFRTSGGEYGPFSYLPGGNTRLMGGFGKRVRMLPTGTLGS